MDMRDTRTAPTRDAPGNRYMFPIFEDGSTYVAGDPIYDYITNNFSVQDWNALPEDQRWQAINQAWESVKPFSDLPTGDHRDPRYENYFDWRMRDDLASTAQNYHDNPPQVPSPVAAPTPDVMQSDPVAALGQLMRTAPYTPTPVPTSGPNTMPSPSPTPTGTPTSLRRNPMIEQFLSRRRG